MLKTIEMKVLKAHEGLEEGMTLRGLGSMLARHLSSKELDFLLGKGEEFVNLWLGKVLLQTGLYNRDEAGFCTPKSR